MNTDIRLSVGFIAHPKTVKLIRRLGHQGVFSLITLWSWAARNRSDGVLNNMDEEDLAIAAAWDGEPERLVRTLLDLCFLDCRNGVWSLHDWAEHQAYVVQEPVRRARAQQAALARWDPPRGEETDAAPCVAHASGMPGAHSSNAPIPTDPVEEDHTLTSFECVSAPDGPDA